MWPYVITKPIPIGSYGVMMAIGFLTAMALLTRELRRRHIDEKVAETTIFLGIVFGVLGAKLAYMLTEADRWSWKDLVSGSGLTWHGGLILAASVIIGWFVWKRLPLMVMLDAVAPTLATGYAFGRVGCQIAGDGDFGVSCMRYLQNASCWVFGSPVSGDLSDACFGAVQPEGVEGTVLRSACPIDFCIPDGFPGFCMSYARGIVPSRHGDIVYATPVYEAINNFLLFGLLWALRKRIRHPGVLFAIYLIGSGFLRFGIEFIRQDEGRPYRFWGLRDAHLVALGQVALGLAIAAYAMLRKVPATEEYGVLPVDAAPASQPSKARKKGSKGGR
jgi:prolipoprotein diacylglyceryltransferase